MAITYQAELAELKRKQASLAANGEADEAAELDEEIVKLRESTAKQVRKRAAAETAKDSAVSDPAVVEKSTTRHR